MSPLGGLHVVTVSNVAYKPYCAIHALRLVFIASVNVVKTPGYKVLGMIELVSMRINVTLH